MRRNIDGLDYLADRALPHQFAGVDGRLHFEQLAVQDRVDALGLGDRLAHLGQLLEGGQAGLVRENSPCRASWRALRSPARSLAICEVSTSCTAGSSRISSCVVDDLHIGEPLAELRQLVVLAAPRRHQLAAAPLHRANHAVDVVVAHAADGKLDVILGRLFSLHGKNRVFHSRAAPPPKANAFSGRPAISPPIPQIPSILPASKTPAAA